MNRHTMPPVIEYPLEGEEVRSRSYMLRVDAADDAVEVEAEMDGSGVWFPCGRRSGKWWFEAKGLRNGHYEIAVRSRNRFELNWTQSSRRFLVRLPDVFVPAGVAPEKYGWNLVKGAEKWVVWMEAQAAGIDWSKQHCGVHHAPFEMACKLMPDLTPIFSLLPDARPGDYTWDVKVHMLMPRQYPCIPNWHVDNVPRVQGIQDFSSVPPPGKEAPMWCWISGAPLTQFEDGYLLPNTWRRFTQRDRHRGTAASEFGWRGFVRATHKSIMEPKPGKVPTDWLRRHAQVYLDAADYKW